MDDSYAQRSHNAVLDILKRTGLKRPSTQACTSCLTTYQAKNLITLPCKHPYCDPCLKSALASLLHPNNPKAFTYCPSSPPLPLDQATPFLPTPALLKSYRTAVSLTADPSPLYCATPPCAAYVPITQRTDGLGSCTACNAKTCMACRSSAHRGPCKEDEAGQRVVDMGKEQGWQSCPRCGMMAERKEGCPHMSCPCGQDFCYGCGEVWREGCRGRCEGVRRVYVLEAERVRTQQRQMRRAEESLRSQPGARGEDEQVEMLLGEGVPVWDALSRVWEEVKAMWEERQASR
jgi:E3 ubiquitin-protein ligase RNF144